MTPDEAFYGAVPAVYKIYDADGVLLYIGSTKNGVRKRVLKHRRHAKWWPQADAISTWTFADIATARAYEADSILFEAPLFNVQHNRQRPENDVRNRRSA